MIEILFISYLSKNILKIKINIHKKVGLFLVVPLIILELISNSLPEVHHSNKSDEEEYLSDYNIFKGIDKKV